jgi:biopolymer transport protein ExbD
MMRSTASDSSSDSPNIDLAPMIDCVFLLLIFFIVTSVFVRDPGVEVERPDVSGATAIDRKALLVAIDAEDRIHVDGQEIRLEQVATILRQSAVEPDTPVIVRADRKTSHGMFAAVYTEAKRAGLRYVQFATARGETQEEL